MNRLREETGSDPTRVRGVQILRSTGALENNPEMKQRVWVAVLRSRRLAHRPGTTRPGLLRRRPAFLAGLLLLFAATAGAVIGRRVVEQHATSLATPASVAPRALPAVPPHATRRQLALAPTPTVVDGPSPSPRATASRSKDRPPLARRAPLVSVSGRSTQGGHQMLLDAMVALRRDREAQRAGELLERFLNDFPRSALREEALALSVEAALARDDTWGRDRWARAYLQGYPSGRFRDFVEGSLRAQ